MGTGFKGLIFKHLHTCEVMALRETEPEDGKWSDPLPSRDTPFPNCYVQRANPRDLRGGSVGMTNISGKVMFSKVSEMVLTSLHTHTLEDVTNLDTRCYTLDTGFKSWFILDVTAKLKIKASVTPALTCDSERGGRGLQDTTGDLSHARLLQYGFSSWL